MMQHNNTQIHPDFSWDSIDRVFLDLDGTLLDKYFDDYFWESFVPKRYAQKYGVDFSSAREKLLQTYRSVENTLQWTDLDYWSKQIDLDIPALKKEIDHLVQIHPHIIRFFSHMNNKGKELYLITNAHPKALEVKMQRVNITDNFIRIVCSQEVGAAKEQPLFWERLQQIVPYERSTTLFVDDTERVLAAAREYGLQHLIHIAKPSSRLPVQFSASYPSIETFRELLF